MLEDIKCVSCGTNLISEEGWTSFNCPSCSGAKITRCDQCRKGKVEYGCKACGFHGP